MSHRLRAGTGRVDITPPLTAPHANWGAQVHVLPDGVESNLWVTALVVEDGESQVAFVDLDIVILSTPESEAIRTRVSEELGMPPENIRVSVTHNHAGPPPSAWNWAKVGQAAMDGYYALLPELAAGAARAAAHNLRPARVSVGSGSSHVAVNRREQAPDGRICVGVNPDGPMDPEVFVVRIDGEDGPIAAIVGYTMHPTTMGPSNRRISSDWPGYLKRTVEHITGATCLFAQGATGNVGPGYEGFTDRAEVIQSLGGQIGCEAARVFMQLRTSGTQFQHERIWESGAPLGVWSSTRAGDEDQRVRAYKTTVSLSLRPQPPLAEAEQGVVDAQARLDTLKASGAPASEIEAATFVCKRSNMKLSRVRTYGGKTHSSVEVHVLQIGPAVIVGTEGEPFCEIGHAIKDQSPFPHTWFGGYTSGWAGYIPMPDAYPLGGYEVDISPFAPEAAGEMVDGTVAALKTFAAS